MIYGQEKTIEMMNSVLISKKKIKKDRRFHHKQHRNFHREKCHDFKRNPDLYEEDDGQEFRNRTDAYDLHYAKADRREADNVKPLMRWAQARFSNDPFKLRAVMPAGTIGEHAISHCVYLDGFEDLQAKRGVFPTLRYVDPVPYSEWPNILRRILNNPYYSDFVRWLNSKIRRHNHNLKNYAPSRKALEENIRKMRETCKGSIADIRETILRDAFDKEVQKYHQHEKCPLLTPETIYRVASYRHFPGSHYYYYGLYSTSFYSILYDALRSFHLTGRIDKDKTGWRHGAEIY